MAENFQCTIVTPEAAVLDQPVAYASIPAWDGLLGVMHRRAPLLVKLGYGPLRLEGSDGSERRYYVGGGFAQMNDNRLTILTEEAIPSEKVDRAEVEAALREAEAFVPQTPADRARRERDLTRARAKLATISRGS